MRINIDESSLEDIKRWFADYVTSFKKGEPEIQENIELKEDHTYRVCKEILTIGIKLDLSDDELRLAEIIALLHDVGRFEQYAGYGTFNDGKSVNHAGLGIEIILRNGVLDTLDISIRDLVIKAIAYHNRVSLPDDETETCLFYSMLLRDADKLDIWKVVTDYYHRKDGKRNHGLELELPDTAGVSAEVLDDIRNGRAVNMKNIRNLNDFKLLQMAWIFDINFKPTRDIIKERNYLDKIRAVLPQSPETEEIFSRIYKEL
ncbi:MAG: HD domain-containing protein [Bacteroidales bacterium]|nr:HD domain-containing protein [Bacteroidales bacterium]